MSVGVLSEVLESYFDFYPSSARDIGRDEYDSRFPEIFRPSPEILQDLRQRVTPLESATDPEIRADARTMLAWLDREAFRGGVEGRRHRGPMESLSEADVWNYIKKPYGTFQAKCAAIEEHLWRVPTFLQQAGRLLDSSLPAGERLRSMEYARALAADLRSVVALLANEHPDPPHIDLMTPAHAAAEACEQFGEVIDGTAPEAGVLGPERLREWVHVSEGIDMAPSDMFDEAQAEVHTLIASLDSLSAQFGVQRRRDLHNLMEGPAPADTTLGSLRRIMAHLREFWVDRNAVEIATVNPLEFRLRPRMFAAAQFGLSGPFDQAEPHPHYLYLPENADSPHRVNGQQQVGLPVLEMLAVHETYAGHYLHTETVFRERRYGPRTHVRIWAGFVEGWAHYAEELAIEHGLDEGRPLVYAAQQLAALEAATRLLVFMAVNSGRWTFAEAVQHVAVIREIPAHRAAREVLGAASDWQASLYTFGKLRIRQWRRSVGVGSAPPEQKVFHDRLLRCGFAPLGVVWQYYQDTQRHDGVRHA